MSAGAADAAGSPSHLAAGALDAGPAGDRGRDLTDEQREAVARRSGSLLLSAGAGSGKTSVLVERFVQAVLIDGIEASAILAITFTERAAWELKERVRRRMRELGSRRWARAAEEASVGTFHGFCARVLRSDPLAAGLPPGFQILEETLAGRLRRAAFAQALRELVEEREQSHLDVLAAYGVDRLEGIVLGAHSQLRSRGMLSPALPMPAGTQPGDASASASDSQEEAALRACATIDVLLRRFGEHYERRKRSRGAADFDDLELRALSLLQGEQGVRQEWSQRFQMLMVDEFQDTNPRQLALLSRLERENLFTVGDEWQSIYGFRHADVSIFRERRQALSQGGASIALTGNFRSRPGVIDTVNAVFCERFGERYSPLQAQRPRSQEPTVEMLLTDADGWDEDPRLEAAIAAGLPSAPRWRQAEARLLASRTAELIASGAFAAGEIAVLLRAAKDLPVYERALTAAGVPTLAMAGGFWLDAQVADLVAYLRALANPYDELALHGTLSSPLVGLSADALALLAAEGRKEGGRFALWETLRSTRGRPALQAGDEARLQAFLQVFLRQRSRLAHLRIAELLQEAVGRSGYAAHVLALPDGRRRLANVRKLIGLAAQLERSEGPDLRGFLDHVEHLSETRGSAEPDAPVADGDLDAVRLMTIHAAKGLEFPVVCVADLGRAPNRSNVPDLLLDGERVGLRLAGLDGEPARPVLDYESLRSEREQAEAAEEDRILYVAMTRARELLLLSGAASFAGWPKPGPRCPPIAWLAPALVEDLPRRLAAGAPDVPEPVAGAAAGEDHALRCVIGTPARAQGLIGLPDPQPAEAVASEAGSSAPDAPAAGSIAAAPPPAPARAPAAPASGAHAPAAASAVPAGPGDVLSYTALAALERCGYRYYLERVLHLPEASPPRAAQHAGEGHRPGGADGGLAGSVRDGRGGLDARVRGEIVHRMLETFDFGSGAAARPAQAAAAAASLGVEIGRRESGEIAELLAGLCDGPLAARLAAARVLGRERPFAFALSGNLPGGAPPLIAGALDLVATEHDGTWLIVDYKTGSVAPGEDLDLLASSRFGVQRLVYALAALLDGAGKVEVAHWFLQRPSEPVAARYEASQRAQLEGELLQRIERARAKGFTVSESPHAGLCLTCPGREGLCSWGERETLRSAPDRRDPAAPDR